MQTNVTHTELCWLGSPKEKSSEDPGAKKGRPSVEDREGDFLKAQEEENDIGIFRERKTDTQRNRLSLRPRLKDKRQSYRQSQTYVRTRLVNLVSGLRGIQ